MFFFYYFDFLYLCLYLVYNRYMWMILIGLFVFIKFVVGIIFGDYFCGGIILKLCDLYVIYKLYYVLKYYVFFF